jgi:hypothetical protein
VQNISVTDQPFKIRPELSEYNREIYGGWLEISEGQLAEWGASGLIETVMNW